MKQDTDVREVFARLIGDEPALRLDAGRAVVAGRAARRRRASYLGGSVVLASSLAVAGVVVVSTHGGGLGVGDRSASVAALSGSAGVGARMTDLADKLSRKIEGDPVPAATMADPRYAPEGGGRALLYVPDGHLRTDPALSYAFMVSGWSAGTGPYVSGYVLPPQPAGAHEFDACAAGPVAEDIAPAPVVTDCARMVLADGTVVRTAHYQVRDAAPAVMALVYRGGYLELVLAGYGNGITASNLVDITSAVN